MNLVLKALGVNALSLGAQLISLPLAPVAALFVKNSRLRTPFKWMDTPDTNLTDFGNEPSILKIKDKLGQYPATVMWLWRNKAYAFRFKFATKDRSEITVYNKGPIELYRADESFDLFFKILEKPFRLYFRFGWKIMPLYDGYRPEGATAVGMPVCSFRTDNNYE